jgi:DNA/RNA endonuclease YhcR with UshA esterase domain
METYTHLRLIILETVQCPPVAQVSNVTIVAIITVAINITIDFLVTSFQNLASVTIFSLVTKFSNFGTVNMIIVTRKVRNVSRFLW